MIVFWLLPLLHRFCFLSCDLAMQADSITSSPGEVPPAYPTKSRSSDQPADPAVAAVSSDLSQQEATSSQALPHASSDTDQCCNTHHEQSNEACSMSCDLPNGTSEHSPEPDQDSQPVPLEEGELPDTDLQASDSEPHDFPAYEDMTPEQRQSLAEIAAILAKPIAKRKRGERAGKRVRQRQAKRARDIELGLRLQDGTRVMTDHAPKRLVSKRKLPTCKYVTRPS